MKQKDELRILRGEMAREAISVKKFLMIFNLADESILDKKISHKDLDILLPNLRRVGFDRLIRNKSMLHTGDVIAIRDSFGYVLPYLNPKLIYSEDEFYRVFDCEQDKTDVEIKKIVCDENLEPYELKEVCSKLLELRRFKEYRVIKRMLSKSLRYNSKKVKKYKREKQMLKERDMEYEY